MPESKPEPGDKVSWNWGSGAPGGTVETTKTSGEIAIKSKRGNTIKKKADPSNPAVHVRRSGNDVVKKASELNVESKGGGKKRKAADGDDDQREESAEDGGDGGEKEDAKKENGEGGLTKNDEGKDVRAGGKKAKKNTEKKTNGTNEEVNGTKGKTEEKTPAKAKPGRPKKDAAGSGEPKQKPKKRDAKPRAAGGVSARTRSRA